MAPFTPRQKQIIAGGLLIAFGIATGVVIAPGDPRRDDRLAEVGSAFGSASVPPGTVVDTADYSRFVGAARAGRNDLVDMLSADVAPGAVATFAVNAKLGARPASFDLLGPAVGRFETTASATCPTCGLAFVDVPQAADGGLAGHTTLTITARNTSAAHVRLAGFIHCVAECTE